jgi:hypothetical protein
MSFEVFVQCFQNGEFAGLHRQCVRDIFGTCLIETEPNFWHLRYDDTNSCNLYLTSHDSDPRMVSGITVNRPCGDERLWDALASILALGNVELYFPGGPLLVYRISVKQHLPQEMTDALGQPKVVANGSDIQRELQMV